MQQSKSSATRRVVMIGLMSAIAVLLSLVPGFSIIPVVSFIKYEYSDLPIIITALALGTPAGLLTAFISVGISFLLGIEGGAHWGALQHFIAIGANAAVAGLIYHFRKTKTGAVIGLSAGIIARTLIMIPANILITPLYTGAPVEAVKGLLLPGIIPVNFIKSTISAVITFFVYKRLSPLLQGKK